MLARRAIVLVAVVLGTGNLALGDDAKKPAQKPAEAKGATAAILGTWEVTAGNKAGNAIGDEAKMGEYVITKDTITIMGEDNKPMFVIKYTLDEKQKPVALDMEITEGPIPEVKGQKALGILEVQGEELKIAYDPMAKERPKDFKGESAYAFTLKKKAAKKDK